MSDRFFLDTNIFAYSFDRLAREKANRASRLISQAISTRKGVVSYQVVQEFFNLALNKFPQPISVLDAEQYLVAVFRPLLAVQSSQELFTKALHLRARNRLGWYDSLIVAAALESECKLLYTEDLQHGQRFGELQIYNPFQ
ncbi:MAG TPA: PIN domain-containing protein [Candidatus Angelobacter sp.]|nr:PIN domain-containing protein [Candidatus Angelobacter sp.]